MKFVKTFLLMLGLMALFMWVGSFFGHNGMLFGLIFGGITNLASYWWSDKIVLKMSRAQPATEAEYPQLYATVRRLATKAQLPMPKVYIVPMPTPNAFATGRDPAHGVVAVSPSIMQLLSQDELEGVLAHEMGHIKNRDILIATVAACLAGVISYLAHMAQWAAIFGGFGGRDNRDSNPIGMIVMIIVAPIAALLLQLAISRSREYAADKAAARLTGRPIALASALRKIHGIASQHPVNVEPATASLYIANPLSARGFKSLFSTHPPMEERVKRLEEMARGIG